MDTGRLAVKKLHLLRSLFPLLFLSLTACGGGGGGGGTTTTLDPGTNNPTGTLSSQGSSSSPVVLGLSGLPYSGTVGASSTSYYQLQGLTPGLDYAITFDSISTSIFPQIYSGTTLSTYQSCFTRMFSSASTCIAAASSSGEMYIVLYDSSVTTGSNFRISAALATEAGQGSPSAPVTISAPANYSGTLSAGTSTTDLDPGNSGYYQINGLTPGNSYLVQLDGMSVGADLYLYQDSFGALACRSNSYGTMSDYCYITAKGSSILARVRAKDSGDFTLSSLDQGAATIPSAEGSPSSEVTLLVDNNAYITGSVDETRSYYTVTGLVPGQQYITTIDSLTDNANLYVYSDSNYTNLSCASLNEEKADDECTAIPNASGQLWIAVDGSTALAYLGATYAIRVTREYESQGSTTAPQLINAATELPYRLTVGNSSDSYYKVTGLTANTTYLVSHHESKNSPDMSVYPTTGFSSYPSCSRNSDYYNHCSGTTNDAGELFLSLSPSYYGSGGTTYVNVSAMPTAQGSTTAPLVTDMSSLPNGFSGEAQQDIDSAYELTGLTPSTSYYILVSFDEGERAAAMAVYNTFSGDLASETSVCGNSYIGLNNGCTATSDATGKLWLTIGGWSIDVGSHFTVEALPVPTAEGSSFASLDITASLPSRSTVGSDIDSFYMVSGLTSNSEYMFSRDGTSTGSYLSVYNDSAHTDLVCYGDLSSGGRDKSCVGAPTGNTVYIIMDNTGYLTNPGYATLDMTAVPPAEGSGLSPVQVSGSSYSGSVNPGVSVYKLSLAADTPYTISLTGVSGDPDLYVFNNAAMTGTAQCSSQTGEGHTESCQATSDSNGNLWVVVDGSLSRGGASYLLQAN